MKGKTLNTRRPSPALVISLVALFAALGGTSYAVATNSIDSREIKNNSVRSADIRNGTIVGTDIKAATRNALKGSAGPKGETGAAGPAGANGAAGPSGPAGTARAYAQVNDTGPAFVALRTKGFTAVTRPETGVYCLTVDPAAGVTVGGDPSVPTAGSVEFGNTAPALNAPSVQVRGSNVTCASGQLEVRTFDSGAAVNTISFTLLVP